MKRKKEVVLMKHEQEMVDAMTAYTLLHPNHRIWEQLVEETRKQVDHVKGKEQR